MALAPETGGEGPAGEAKYPCGEGRVSTERIDRREDVGEHLLSRLFSVRAIAKSLVEEAVDALEVALIDVVEGFAVTGS